MKLSAVMLVVSVGFAIGGCAADAGDDELNDEDVVDQSEDPLLKKTKSTSSWSYRGLGLRDLALREHAGERARSVHRSVIEGAHQAGLRSWP